LSSHHPKPGNALLTTLVSIMVLSWVFNFILAKLALRHFDPVTLAAFRVELAALILVVVYLALPARWHDEIAGPNRQTRFDRHDLKKFVQLGILGVVMNQFLFTAGLSYTTVGHSALIIGVGPIITLLMARFFGLEHITWRKLGGMGLAFFGVAVLLAEKGLGPEFLGRTGNWIGDLITFSGSTAFALYTVLGKRVAARYDSIALNLYVYAVGAILVLPLAIWRGLRLDWGAVGWEGWVGLAYMAVFASVVAYLIYYWALRHMAASRLAAFSYLMPLLATILGILLLGERVTWYLLVGGAFILLGVSLIERAPRAPRELPVVQP
jgi:drug/metabolite transporter (DMT)-like permease